MEEQKVLKGPARFLRYNNDGSIDERQFRYESSAKRGSYKNPFLKNGDVIMITNSTFYIINEVIDEGTSPFKGIFSFYGAYKIINGD